MENDFGWEDQYYLIGRSNEKTDFPFVLPGAYDYWGGTSQLAGIRPHELNLLFGIDSKPTHGDWQLIIDILDCNPEDPPFLKVSVNDKIWKFRLEKGQNASALKGEISNTKEQKLIIPISSELINEYGNNIQLTTLEGSWLVFDQIRLEGPENIKLIRPEKVFVRAVLPGEYELDINGNSYQPLLLDVQHLEGTPSISVKLDGNEIFKETVENGRNVYEVPMPAVTQAKKSEYSILLDGYAMEEGSIERSPQKTNKWVDYVDTKIGTGHSRWMIAPGPWMPFSMVKISPDNQKRGWQAGYQPTFESIGTFSHIHEWTMAGLGHLPDQWPPNYRNGYPRTT